MKNIKPSALLLLAVTFSLLGLATVFVVLTNGFGAASGLLDQTLIVGGALVVILGVAIWLLMRVVVAPVAVNTGATAKRRSGRPWRTNPRQRHSPVQLAHLHYKLDDPLDPQAFNGFLDQVLFIADEDQAHGRYHTPMQVIEDAVIRAIHELEESYQDRVTVEVKFSRASLTLGLTFLAAYEFLAQYHDFVESITLIQQQLRRVIGDTGRWYQRLTGREMQVETDVAIESPATFSGSGAAKEAWDANRHAAAAPARSVRSPMPTATTNEVRVNIYTSSLSSVVFGCVTVSLIIVTLVIVALSLYCQLGEASGACQHIWQSIVGWLARLLSSSSEVTFAT